MPGQAGRNREAGGGGGGSTAAPQIFTEVDLSPIDNDSENKKSSKKI